MAIQDTKPSSLSRVIAALGGLLVSLIALAPFASFTMLTITNHGFMLLMLVILGGLIAISAVGRLNQASILGLLAYVMALLLASWSWFYRDPVGSMLRLTPLLIIPVVIIGVQVKLFNSSSSQGVSPLFSIGSLLLMYQPWPGPLIGAAWGLAGGITSAYEAFSMPTLPALTYIVTYLIGSMMQGTLPWNPISLTPLSFYRVFVNNIAVYSNPAVLSLVIVMAVVYVASPSIARLIKGHASPILASLLASVASIIPMLTYDQSPILLITQTVAILLIAALPASYAGVWYVNSTDVLPMLYGSIADIPDRYNLMKYYHEDWEALIGLDSAKRELIIAAESFRSNGVRPIHGILLYGPAGTGKTALGLGYAAWLGLYRGFRVILVKSGRLMRGGSWEAAWRLERVFALARALQPSVIYIDEVDSIGRAREEAGTGGYRLVSVLLQNIDGVASRYDKVLVVATTNNVNALDEALIRPGRLGDLKIYVAKPPPELVKAIIMGVARQRGVIMPNWLLEKAGSLIETGAEAEALVNCIAVKQLAGVNDATQLEACLAGITKGIEAYDQFPTGSG
ncbi:AAA family ATPase [Caldivirga maquilingensis]|uniref:AAA ATPase central domain protein n=1 Tax=Caldivirga maquilingensis (strain ATCC 700844 / DSM 13496 / JCM 10307 / IC-167) TaxID=397948 RepID=A8MB32_CALMQ|nr:ATP-binding protein [Caldivirga maquilingensis]ABW02661.1 AAA ATPase central domain protein [Caldivirga maquilingensis IC-167]